MAPWNLILRMVVAAEDYIVAQILRSPGFHRGVRSIHDRVNEHRHGRNPHDPLRPGEASRDPDQQPSNGFFGHFVEELRNQARGRPSSGSHGPTPPTTTTKNNTDKK
ncbi:MIOREX complex component 7 [Microdochium nivale]|nr:MIOREX complex component 7 [Microdochium nivale]